MAGYNVVVVGTSTGGLNALTRLLAAQPASIKERGGYLIVQDPQSAESSFMPRHAVKYVPADRVLDLGQIATELVTRSSQARPG
jgi:chemotaxis response regulator CheB